MNTNIVTIIVAIIALIGTILTNNHTKNTEIQKLQEQHKNEINKILLQYKKEKDKDTWVFLTQKIDNIRPNVNIHCDRQYFPNNNKTIKINCTINNNSYYGVKLEIQNKNFFIRQQIDGKTHYFQQKDDYFKIIDIMNTTHLIKPNGMYQISFTISDGNKYSILSFLKEKSLYANLTLKTDKQTVSIFKSEYPTIKQYIDKNSELILEVPL